MIIEALERHSTPDSVRGLRNKIEKHGHLEGELFPSQLFAIADKLHIQISQSSREQIQTLFNEAVKNSQNSKDNSLLKFIARLSTRWMRLFHAKIILTSSTAQEAQERQLELESEFVSADLEQKYRVQGLEFTNLLYSPFNMTGFGGNLSFNNLENLIKDSLITEERETYEELLKKFSTNKGEYFARTVRVQSYALQIYKTATDFEEKVKAEGGKFRVFKSLSLRRNDIEQEFLSKDPDTSSSANGILQMLHRLFTKGFIDAVDICGNEADERYSIEKMSDFLHGLINRKVFVTAHVGELRYTKKRKLAKKNLQAIQDLNGVKILAHGIRLLDKNNEDSFKKAGEQKQILAINLMSNLRSHSADRPSGHALMKGFDRLMQSPVITVFTTDDHIATYKEGENGGRYLEAEQEIAIDAIRTAQRNAISVDDLENYLDIQAHRSRHKLESEVKELREASRDIFGDQIVTEEVITTERKAVHARKPSFESRARV